MLCYFNLDPISDLKTLLTTELPINNKRFVQAQCPFVPAFPRFFGGPSGTTGYRSVSVYNENIALAGISNDPTLVPSATFYAFVAYMPLGSSLAWVKYSWDTNYFWIADLYL